MKDTSRRATAEELKVAKRMRTKRILSRISQGKLGEMVGLTFQQIQKYESGQNRIPLGRLFHIAGALNVSVSFLLGERGESRVARAINDTEAQPSRDALKLLHTLMAIEDDRAVKQLLALARTMAGQSIDDEDRKAA